MWWFPMLKWIMKMKGVIRTHFNMTDYGALWKKSTCVLRNSLVLYMLKLDLDIEPSVPLRGQIWHEGALVFPTSLACAYPPALGGYAAKLAAATIGEQGRCGYACKEHDDGNPLEIGRAHV
jgi:hypothetical protein